MGNQLEWHQADTNFSSEEQLLADLIHMQDIQCDNLTLNTSNLKIYRFRQAPYDYVMQHKKYFMNEDTKYQHYKNNVSNIAMALNYRSIARIHNIKVCKEHLMCITQMYVQCYVNYYSLNLQQIIYQRKKDDVRFTTSQMWYIMKSLLDLSGYLKDKNIIYGNYFPKNMFLTPQGYLKIYLFHLLPNNQHSIYYSSINEEKDIYKNLPAPELLPYLFTHDYCQKIDLMKIDIFNIGMILLEMMIHGSTKKYYNIDQLGNKMLFDTILLAKDIKELRNIYPNNLIGMVEKMVAGKPSQRANLEQLRNQFGQMRQNIAIGGSIRMYEDEQNQIQPKVSYKDIFGDQEFKAHNILSSINMNDKLQVCAINPPTLRKPHHGVNLTNKIKKTHKHEYSATSSLNKRKLVNIQLYSVNKSTHRE